MGGYLSSWFGSKGPKTPVNGCFLKLKNFVKCHYKGLIGIFIPIFALIPLAQKGNNAITVALMWIWMFWFFLWQPVDIPVTAMIPIFLLPMTGVMSTMDTCKCYFNENVGLLILSGMLILLLNNSGVDRRIALWLICSGDSCQFSGKSLVFKFSTAAFFLSMFSNRLIIVASLMQYITPALMDMHSSRGGSKTDANYQEMRYIINNAIQTSSAIGSTAIVHASAATLLFRGIFVESPPKGSHYEDIFNYMQFSAFAFPVALIQFMINLGYHMVLINSFGGAQMPASSIREMRRILLKLKSSVPLRVTLHEKLTVFFMLFALIIFFFRWCPWLQMGWATFNATEIGEKKVPTVKDSTVAAIFVIALHVIPKGYMGFVQYLSADKKSQLPPIKPQSAILWWKYVDKNLNYGYIFVLGGGIALCNAVRDSELAADVTEYIGKSLFDDFSWNSSVFLVCLVASLLSNFMSGVGVVISLMPIILHLAGAPAPEPEPEESPGSSSAKPLRLREDWGNTGNSRFRRQGSSAVQPRRWAWDPWPTTTTTAAPTPLVANVTEEPPNRWPDRLYLGALAVGLCGSYGFMLPFVYTPAYICSHTGKTPISKMIKYSFLSVAICVLVLWIALLHWAPIVWDPEDEGFKILKGGNSTNTTTAAAGGTS